MRCANHPHREAVARCVKCGRFFCRECITEHHDRMYCSACLLVNPEPGKGRRFFSALCTAARMAGGVLILWLAFYGLGKALLLMPDHYHQGEIRNSLQSENE
jgi:hypothetical protein